MISRLRPSGDSAAVLALSLMLTAGCGDGAATANSLVSIEPIPAGATCPYGGVGLSSGVDVDTNGVLDPAEVTDTQTVCNGPQADPQVLVGTAMLSAGSSLCTYGGTQIDTGLDNGDAGGVAGNGTLEAGEVDSTTAICTGQAVGSFDMTRPGGAVGTAQVTTSGGARTGAAGSSGAGGTIQLGAGNTPSSYAVFDTGTADTTHTIPTLTITLGSDGETVAANTTLTEIPAAAPVEGRVYIDPTPNTPRLVRYHAAPTPRYTPITGLRVNAGVTLTVSHAALTSIPFAVDGDLDVQGTITTQLIGTTRPSLTIAARNIAIGAAGVVDLSAVQGGSNGAAGSLALYASGTFVSAGALKCSGAYHLGTASASGSITVAASELYNTGTITAIGGSTVSAPGENGGAVWLTGARALVNDGSITTTGGPGTGGGKAGDVSLALTAGTASLASETLFSTGSILADGGRCTTNGQSGGQGGNVRIVATSAWLRHNAAIDASGGGARLASPPIIPAGDCAGGAGGSITLRAVALDAAWDAASLADVSGNLNASGTTATRGGGVGGSVNLEVVRPQGALMRLLGYATLQASGGTGGAFAADAGSITHATVIQATMGGVFGTFIPEQVHIYAAMTATGGDSGAFYGGTGGSISFSHQIDGATSVGGGAGTPALLIAGPVDVQPGFGSLFAGFGGQVSFRGYGDVVLESSIRIEGPDSWLNINTTGDVTLLGDVSVVGLTDVVGGGGSNAGNVSMVGGQVTVGGDIAAHGGNGTSGNPGDGGGVIISSRDAPSTVTGDIDVSAGTGGGGVATNFDAATGTIVVDGLGI